MMAGFKESNLVYKISYITYYISLEFQISVIILLDYACIQLFRERLLDKNVHATIPKGNMGYDQYIVPDTVAVELSFVAFL